MTPPILRSAVEAAAAAMEAAAAAESAISIAKRAEAEFALLKRLKKIWEGISLLLEDEAVSAFANQKTESLAPELKSLVCIFSAMQNRYQELETHGFSAAAKTVFEQLPVVDKDDDDASLDALEMQLHSLTKDFSKQKNSIHHQLGKMEDSLDMTVNMVKRARISSSVKLCIQQAEDVSITLDKALLLAKPDWSVETRSHALHVMKIVILNNWDEISVSAKAKLTDAAIGLLPELGGPLQNFVVPLITELVEKGGLPLWQLIMKALSSLFPMGTTEVEVLSNMLMWLPTKISRHNNMEDALSRQLRSGLVVVLPKILSLLHSLLQMHSNLSSIVEQGEAHVATVKLVQKVINTYAVYASPQDLSNSRLTDRCAELLLQEEFKEEASVFFSILSSRSQPLDAGQEFDEVMD